MAFDFTLKIPKKEKVVTMWIHPQGRVVGALFLSLLSRHGTREEEPVEVLNQATPFVVIRHQGPEGIRFYNKAAIVRVEYTETPIAPAMEIPPLYCRLYMMDGSLIEGCIRHLLPPDHARLYDYLNLRDEAFVKLHVGEGNVCLVNKAYIVQVTSLEASQRGPSDLRHEQPQQEHKARL